MAVFIGASKRNRTAGLRFTRASLYQLSYAGEVLFSIFVMEHKIISRPIYQVMIENSTIIQYMKLHL